MTQAGTYPIEPELRGATPRRVQYSKPIRNLLLFLKGSFTVVALLISFLAYRDLTELRELDSAGQIIGAHVTGRYQIVERGTTLYNVEYTFHANDRDWKGDERVQQSEWEQMLPGSSIPVLYLPSNPGVNRIGAEISGEKIEHQKRYWITLTVVVVLFAGWFGWLINRDLGRQRALLSDGVAVAAEIVSCVAVNPSMTATPYKLTYRYVTSSGEMLTKTLPVPAAVRDWLGNSPALTILYDARRPAIHRPYYQFRAVTLA